LPSHKKTQHNEIRNTLISWYDIKVSEIYWKNKEAWQPVSLTINFPAKFGCRQSSFHHVYVVFFTSYCIITSCIYPYVVTFGIFVSMFNWMSWLRCERWRNNRMRTENVKVLEHVTWRLVLEICELWTCLCKLELSH